MLKKIDNILVDGDQNNDIRWRKGQRLHHLFEECYHDLEARDETSHLAVIEEGKQYSFEALEHRANQLAHYLKSCDIGEGDRVGLLLNKSFLCYVTLLAVSKVGAAYVPLDASFPSDRVAYILKDAQAKIVLSLSSYQDNLARLSLPVIFLDQIAGKLDSQRVERLEISNGQADDALSYIIYTSGTTGQPKGVAINHSSIYNFVKVAGEVYGYQKSDRVYQGMTIAFDFSVEELWVPLCVGATLVPGKNGTNLVGTDLHDFLQENRITALCCVPTLLATLEHDLPDLRLLLVSGEACPQDLVSRWHRAGRVMLNAYGPTEATVTATITRLEPDQAVTIGKPLPTYSVVMLDTEEDKTVPRGENGEIAIAGIGLAKEYLNRPDLTDKAFIPDFLNIKNNPSKRLYRTGDLGRITPEGTIEYLGRIDTQVKIRGYRIELTEIESLILELDPVAQAVVDVWESEGGLKELVAYYSLKDKSVDLCHDEVVEVLRAKLPGYMVPSFFEKMAAIPLTSSHKADRKKLPAPKGARYVGSSENYIAPEGEREQGLAQILSKVLGIGQVSVEDNFFADLGAHSLIMARFCALAKDEMPGSDFSMRDVYQQPTIRKLASFVDEMRKSKHSQKTQAPKREVEEYYKASDFDYYRCGLLQAIYYLVFFSANIIISALSFQWILSATALTQMMSRSLVISFALFIGYAVLAYGSKWLIIGRWKQEKIAVWSLRYFQFWMVKQLQHLSPLAVLRGSPLFNLHLRLLGAKIGKNAHIQCRVLPVYTDLVEIGSDSVLCPETKMQAYTVRSGYLQSGAVTLGQNVYVGTGSVLDIDTVMADNSQLGFSSALLAGQKVAKGKHYHGSPAVETSDNYCTLKAKPCSDFRRLAYALVQLTNLLVLSAVISVLFLYVMKYFLIGKGMGQPTEVQIFSMFYSFLAFSVVGIFTGLAGVVYVPRLFRNLIEADKEYALYGWHYFIANLIRAISQSSFYNLLFGDSSFITHYLRAIGWNLNKVHQTGSNFGVVQEHDHPFLCEIGEGTMSADGLKLVNLQLSSSSFKLSQVSVGAFNYLGNLVMFPPKAKVGENCLLASKVLVPIGGEMRENVGLLGSPSFEIPRVTRQDCQIAKMDEKTRQKQLKKKNKYNAQTILFYLASNWILAFLFMVCFVYLWSVFLDQNIALFVFGMLLFLLFSLFYFSFVERMAGLFFRKDPHQCSIYDPYFWQTERYWKLSNDMMPRLFVGTPFRSVLWMLLGVEVGRKLFDDGVHITEKSLVKLGDNVTLNNSTILQGHSLEEGNFKSDFVVLENGCTVEQSALIHYGTTISESSIVETDAFFMKGEVTKPHSIWQGNPAREIG